jgi:poly(glycerol-phosphate) alpha-glucosyltransferase
VDEPPLRVVHALDTISMLGGGVAEAVRGLCLALVIEGVDVRVVAGRDARSEDDLPRWDGVPVTLVEPGGLVDVLTGASLAAAVRQASPDVVHVHGVWGLASRAAARLLGEVPVLLSPHGMFDAWAMRRSRAKKRLSALLWEGRLLRGARLFHALCAAEAESIGQLGVRQRVVTIPNGVALPEPASGSVAAEPRTMLFLGRLHPKKGIAELIAAWAMLSPATRAAWRLVVAGWDELGLSPDWQGQAERLGIADGVAFPGGVQGAAKDAMFRSASAFILPSYSEGLPMAVLEAWSYGLPVFMTDACNLPAGFDQGAAFRITTAPSEMAAALERQLGDAAALSGAGRAGRLLAEREFGWEAVATAMASAYAELCPGKS